LNKKKVLLASSIVVLCILITVGLIAVYVSDYYKADPTAIESFSSYTDTQCVQINKKAKAYFSSDYNTGFIFYPGGKVEHSSYEPLMRQIASKGVLCILVEMPFNLAVLDINAADGIRDLYPEISNWYIGGHSLGGSMAATYIENNSQHFKGLILLGSYSTNDLSNGGINVLSIYGSEDKIMNKDKYEKYKSNLPDTFSEFIINGGNHAYFGMYGNQKGDGVPTITNEEQIIITAEKILRFISEEN